MKQLTIVIGLLVTIMIVGLSIMTIQINGTRKDELYRATSSAVRQTVKKSQTSNQNEIKSNEDMINYFVKTLFTSINSKGNIEVEVMGANCKEGLFDVLVTEYYCDVTGGEKKIAVRKAAIYQ